MFATTSLRHYRFRKPALRRVLGLVALGNMLGKAHGYWVCGLRLRSNTVSSSGIVQRRSGGFGSETPATVIAFCSSRCLLSQHQGRNRFGFGRQMRSVVGARRSYCRGVAVPPSHTVPPLFRSTPLHASSRNYRLSGRAGSGVPQSAFVAARRSPKR